MDMHGPGFVLAIITISMAAWLINNWIRARHGYAPSDDWGRDARKPEGRAIALLTSENEKLHGQISRLEERIAVLERITTDPAARTAREIDALR